MTIIVPISLSVIKFKQLPKELKIIALYLCSSGLSNFISKVLADFSINNLPLAHLYTVVEFGIICFFYYNLLASKKIKKYIPYIFISFFAVCVINALFFQPIFHYNTYTKPIEAILVIGLAISYLLQLLEDFDRVIKNNVELIYINSGFLLYFSGSFVLFTIFNIFVRNTAVAFAILDVHATILLFMYILFTIALWKFKNER